MGRLLGRGAAAAAACLALAPAGAGAATFTAACTGTTGDVGSLAAAIDSANANGPAADVVELGADCVYSATAPLSYWYGPNALPPIASDITIEGNGATITRGVPTAPPFFRFFFVGADPNAPETLNYVTPGPGRLTLRAVTLREGWAQGGSSEGGGGGAGMGGAIFSQGSVTIENSTLSRNYAGGGSAVLAAAGPGGGGIGTSSGPRDDDPAGGFGGAVGGGAGGPGFEGVSHGGGGGAGIRSGQDGAPGTSLGAGAGGGPASGLGGGGGASTTGRPGNRGGDGSGGGGGGYAGGDGGSFGEGGKAMQSSFYAGGGGGGGVGGGGGPGAPDDGAYAGGGGGGGFGGGGGRGGRARGGSAGNGGAGGFGGGGGAPPTALGGSGTPGKPGAPGFGGGSAANGPLNGGGGAGMGGAIFSMHGRLTIRNSTLAFNRVRGGDDNLADPGKGFGGAVFNLSGTVDVTGATFYENRATDHDGNIARYGKPTGDGASIYSLVYDPHMERAARVTLRNTIASGRNGSAEVTVNDPTYTVDGQLNDGSASADLTESNLVDAFVARGNATYTGTPLVANPLLGPLEDNGGPTFTMLPADGSPVIDRGTSAGLALDQRGRRRPSDFFNLTNSVDGADIGAVEVQETAAPDTEITGGTPNGATAPTATFEFSSERGATFECSVDDAPFGACQSPFSAPPLADGQHTFRVRATDVNGNVDNTPATRTFTIAAGSTGGGTTTDTLAPVLTGFSISDRAFRVGQRRRFAFTITEPAAVSIAIERRAAGRRVGRRCLAATRKRADRPRCVRWLDRGALARLVAAGANRVPFSGRIGKRDLRPGRHRAILTATDAAANRSASTRARFRIVR